MKTFINENFLLKTSVAQYLYHNYAEKMPIIDYHCHLSPQMIAENHKFDNIAQAWLYGDHYKWRAMRADGKDERFVTGNATDREKFQAWAETVPDTLRNPLYHWTHLELLRYFNIKELLDERSAYSIWEKTSQMLDSDNFRVWGLLKKMNVETLCTTDDPIDDLRWHKMIKNSQCPIKVLPAWRPDKASAIENPKAYVDYIAKLSETSDIEINSFETLFKALDKRMDYFEQNGCRLADFGVDFLYAAQYSDEEIEKIFSKALLQKPLDAVEILKFKSACLYRFALQVKRHNWVQQFHAGPLRNNNSRLLTTLGPDTGFDSIGDFQQATNMSRLLDRLDCGNNLAKTILYNLNPADNEVFATMIGNFQDGTIAGKMQWGAAWWFLDQKDGMEKQLNCLSNHGLLSRFVGMLTDSRSFLSYPRHEYFRRVLCNVIGNDVENGELPYDMDLLGTMVSNICYNNAKEYFNF